MRNNDVVTGSVNLEDIHTVQNFPVFMGSVDHDQSEDMVADMIWSISRDSGLIQLKKLLPLDVLYQSQTTTSAIGATWMAHHKKFAAFIQKYDPNGVLEIGGAHGILAVEYSKLKSVQWSILEPNPTPVKDCQASFIKGYFDNNFSYKAEFDTVIHSHVFEHVYEPSEFMKHLGSFVKEGQHMIFSIPDLKSWLKNKFTNCLNFEHTYFLIEPYVEYMLAKYGFRAVEKEFIMDGHSIFYAAVRDKSVKPISLSNSLYRENKEMFEEFVEYHNALIREINSKMSDLKNPVYLFGAHVFAQDLLTRGLSKNIVCILDNDKNKQGRRLYGTNLSVQSPMVLKNIEKPVVILKAGIYNEEIKKDILENINSSTIFFE